MGVSKLLILALIFVIAVKLSETRGCGWNKCQRGCRCLVSGYGYNKRKYCEKPPRDPCYSYNCGHGCCEARGHGCHKTAYCVKPKNPCHGYNCGYGYCKVRGHGCHKKAYCVHKPKTRCYQPNHPAHGRITSRPPFKGPPPYYSIGQHLHYACDDGYCVKTTAICRKNRKWRRKPKCVSHDPCHGYRCSHGYKCQSYGHGCYKRKRCVPRNHIPTRLSVF